MPIGMLTAPTLNKEDSRFNRVAKRVNILLAVSSLLSEVLAVVYASIAINKLTEVPSPLTANVAELIEQKYELAWLGTNVHFLYGLMGFGLIVGGKAYFLFGNPVGKIAGLCKSLCMSWLTKIPRRQIFTNLELCLILILYAGSVAAFFQSLSIVNAGIAQGTGDVVDGMSTRFASNFFTLCVRYISLVFKNAKGGACSIVACGILLYSMFLAVKDVKDGLKESKAD